MTTGRNCHDSHRSTGQVSAKGRLKLQTPRLLVQVLARDAAESRATPPTRVRRLKAADVAQFPGRVLGRCDGGGEVIYSDV